MLTQDEIKVAVVMIGRAECKGSEAGAVAAVIKKLTTLYEALAVDDEEDNGE